MAGIFYQQPRVVRNNPLVVRLNRPPAIPHFSADDNCPTISKATILGPIRAFIDGGDVTKRLWETLAASSNPCGCIFVHAWFCWAERTASTMDHEFLYVAKKFSIQIFGWYARPYPLVDLVQYLRSRAREFDNDVSVGISSTLMLDCIHVIIEISENMFVSYIMHQLRESQLESTNTEIRTIKSCL